MDGRTRNRWSTSHGARLRITVDGPVDGFQPKRNGNTRHVAATQESMAGREPTLFGAIRCQLLAWQILRMKVLSPRDITTVQISIRLRHITTVTHQLHL